MPKYTPGPWTAKPSKYHEGSFVVQAGMPSNRVLAKFGSEDEPLDETDIANAHLIAAATSMLDALKQALLYIEADEVTHGRKFGDGNAVRAAIADAEAVTK